MTWERGRLRLLLLLLSVCVRVHSVPIDRETAPGGGEQDEKEGVAEDNVVRLPFPRDRVVPPRVGILWEAKYNDNLVSSCRPGGMVDLDLKTRSNLIFKSLFIVLSTLFNVVFVTMVTFL